MPTRRTCLGAGALALISGCRSNYIYDLTGPAPKPDFAAILAAPDRSEADRLVDTRREQPALLAFIDPRPGMRVLDLAAGGGYTTELLARVVNSGGKTGQVYAQDGPQRSTRAAERFAQRMQSRAMAGVEHVTRPFEDPVPPGAAPLDLITFLFGYHDTVAAGVDRAAMNRRLFEALRPGGVLVVADHSARAGDGVTVSPTLHRIEEALVRRELAAAGFRLLEKARLMQHPEDTRTTRVFDTPERVDAFVLRFVRHQAI